MPTRSRLTRAATDQKEQTMASSGGHVVLNGRFKAGTDVRLVQVRDESVLRAEGGEEVATAPVDPKELAPYPGQGDVPKGTPQRSDTEAGQATPAVDGAPRQQDAKNVPQRSDTPEGIATPIPSGDAVEAARERDSSAAKVTRG